MAGVEVADAIRRFSPIDLALALNRQVVWPFIHSLLLAPAFLFAGPSIAAAEATGLVLYAAAIVLLFVAGTRLHPTRGAWVGLAAATLALLAPAWGLFGTLAMLEVPGALLLVSAFVLHVRAAREPDGGRWLGAAGIASAALFLCKYNYGLMWLAPLAIWEWPLLPEEFRRRVRSGLRARLGSVSGWLRPMPLLFAIGALAIAGILVTGGGTFTLAGQRVSVRSPGNLAYALWLAWLVWWLVPRRARPGQAGGWRSSRAGRVWARLPGRGRILAATIVVPLAVWFTLPWPNRAREFFGFVVNRDSGAPFWTWAGLLFHPRALAADYSPAAWVGWTALALALIPPGLWLRTPGAAQGTSEVAQSRNAERGGVPTARAVGRWSEPGQEVAASVPRSGPGRSQPEPGRRRAGDAAWLAWLAFACGLAAVIVHRDRDSRFLFTVTPLLWLCAASNAVALADAGLARLPWRAIRESAWLAAGIALIAAAWLAFPASHALAGRRAAFRSPARLAPLLAATLDAVADATRADHRARVVLLGESNVLSPGLVAWQARLARPEWPASRLPKRAPYLEPGADDAALAARLDWLEAHTDFVVVALADSVGEPERAEYARETWADRETAARMRDDAARWRPVPARRTSAGSVETFRVGARAPDAPLPAVPAAATRVTPARGVP